MRRAAHIFVTVFAAVGIASFLSLVVVPEARSQAPPEDTSSGSEPYHQVVDNATAGSFVAPGWRVAPASDTTFGEDYAYADPSDDAGPARYTVDIPETDHYAVFARWPGGNDVTTAARFGMDTTSGVQWDEVDQRADADFWVLIGIYEMEQGQRAIQVTRGASGDGRLVADAVMVVGDAMVAPDGRTATTANPDELAGDRTAGDGTLSTQSVTIAASGRDVVRVAKRHLGTPYGTNRCRAFRQEDCSCHTKLVFKKFRYNLPDSPVKQSKMNKGKRIGKKSKLKRGDLVFNDLNGGGMNHHFKDHVSIYAGNGKIIHASNYWKWRRVVISELKYLRGFERGIRLRV
jgi:cell wall-associated NlpC family hydrolase